MRLMCGKLRTKFDDGLFKTKQKKKQKEIK